MYKYYKDMMNMLIMQMCCCYPIDVLQNQEVLVNNS